MPRLFTRLSILALAVGALVYFTAPSVLPRILHWWQPSIVFCGNPARKVLYLTIDDAPTKSTTEILAVLARHKVHATFFVISGRVASESDLRVIVQAGHSLGHHLRTTKACSKLEWIEFKADFDSTAALLGKITPVSYFRPPSDFATDSQLEYAAKRGFTPILGTVFPFDHWISSPWTLTILSRWLAIPGGILIMHDGETRAKRTAAVLDELIPSLKAQGYEFSDLKNFR